MEKARFFGVKAGLGRKSSKCCHGLQLPFIIVFRGLVDAVSVGHFVGNCPITIRHTNVLYLIMSARDKFYTHVQMLNEEFKGSLQHLVGVVAFKLWRVRR